MLQTRALYNLLRLNRMEDSSIQVEPWAIEDLRSFSQDQLFTRLERYQVAIDKKAFLEFARQCDTPEELTDLLLPDSSESVRDPFYLIVFEIWRRLIPEKQSLSIFFDELDHRISLYDQGEVENDEFVQDALANLLEVLDENADTGADPQEIFRAISDYCAHDLESFIFDYISDLFDTENPLYASELIEGFSPYVTEPFWFDFLRARLIAHTDIHDANLAMHRLLENELPFSLLNEILLFLSINGEHELFVMALKKMLPLLSTDEEFSDLLPLVADYYRRLDEDAKEKEVQKFIEERKKQKQAFNVSDPDVKSLLKMLATD